MKPSDATIREMRDGDLDFCVESVNHEGWLSETREVFEDSLAYDRHGCFIAEDDGHTVGMIVATAYDRAGFLGELIVRPEYRGHGLGRQLLEHAIDYLHSRGCGSIYLDGDTPAVPLYERLGFKTVCRSLRFLGRVESAADAHVRIMTDDDHGAVVKLDRELFGADRSFFLCRRRERLPGLCWSLTEHDRVTGYIMGRPGRGVVTVGPWIAPTRGDAALCLLRALSGAAADTPLRIGLLESQNRAVSLIRAIDMLEESEPSWRMVLGNDIGLGTRARIVAIGSPAQG